LFVQSIATGRRLIAPGPRSGALVDAAGAAVVLVASLAILTHGVSALRPGPELNVVGGVLAACATLPLLAWRRAPLGVFVVTAAASTLASGLGYALGIPLGPTVALYLLATTSGGAKPWTWRTTAVVAALFAAYLVATAAADRGFPGLELLHLGLAWAVAWFAGERTRLVREQMAELKERALHAEREAQRDRRLAIAEERTRIARDLHDSAGHAINVIAVRAGAARMRHRGDPDRSLLALTEIEEVARQTADDIDQIVHTLREPGAASGGPAAPPGLASVGTLVAHHARAGLDVSVRSSGDRQPLGHNADQAAYRILQEALTNAARHGAGAALVELAFRDDALGLTVTNPLAGGARRRSGGGHGLIGMRERATLLGGTLEAHREDGVFRVSARIPYGGRRG
jgi:signal transduction histidine kinase